MQHLQTLLGAMQRAAQHGSTTTDLTTNTSPWGQRDQTLPEEIAVSMHSLLRQPKFKKAWITTLNSSGKPTQSFTISASQISPDEKTVLLEALKRPTLTSMMPHLLALATVKKIEASDMSSQAYLRIVFDALNDMSDCAIALGLRDLRNKSDSPWFPQIAQIRYEAEFYNDHYNAMADKFLIDKQAESGIVESLPTTNKGV